MSSALLNGPIYVLLLNGNYCRFGVHYDRSEGSYEWYYDNRSFFFFFTHLLPAILSRNIAIYDKYLIISRCSRRIVRFIITRMCFWSCVERAYRLQYAQNTVESCFVEFSLFWLFLLPSPLKEKPPREAEKNLSNFPDSIEECYARRGWFSVNPKSDRWHLDVCLLSWCNCNEAFLFIYCGFLFWRR